MNSRLLATIIIFPIWLTLILVFRKHRQWLLYYMFAAFGLTIQLVFLAEHFGLDQTLVNMASYHVNLISKFLLKLQMELLSNGRFQLISSTGSSDILKLGIECSAVLESATILSLILFYPVFNWKQKILRASFGLVITYVINIFRLLIIVLMANKFGSDYIFIAHAGIARIFFFLCELLLYWYLITKPTVKSVGDSIQGSLPLDKTAKTGLSFRKTNAIIQIVVIALVVGLSVLSFMVSDEWKKAFAPVARQERPIIYEEETGIEAKNQETEESISSNDKSGDVLGEKIKQSQSKRITIENVSAQGKVSHEHLADFAGKLTVMFKKGTQPVNIEIYRNGEKQYSANMQMSSGKKLDENAAFTIYNIVSGDKIEIKFENIGDAASNYVIELINEDNNE